MQTVKRKFIQHKYAARTRGIAFNFTFKEWVGWWESNLGPNWVELRGRKRGQCVMARNGDKGPYAPWNVRCITCGQNCKEGTMDRNVSKNRGEKHWCAKLTEVDVLAIRSSKLGSGTLAVSYKVHRVTINRIRRKANWDYI